MSNKIDELKLDLQELNTLFQQAVRQKCKDILTLEIRKLQTELSKLLEENKETPVQTRNVTANATNKCYEIKLNNYGWDQTDKTVKLYVTLKDVHTLPKEKIVCEFTKKSVDLRVQELENKNYHLLINNLCEYINTEESYIKVKTDMIIIYLAKTSSKSWSHVTDVEKKIKESKTSIASDMGDENDPGASLMNLMKKMYQEGDDEMKKTIAKAWTERQQNKNPELPDF